MFCSHALYMHEITHTGWKTYIHRHTHLKCRAVETCLVNLFVNAALGGRRELTLSSERKKHSRSTLSLFNSLSSFLYPLFPFCSLPNCLDTFLLLFHFAFFFFTTFPSKKLTSCSIHIMSIPNSCELLYTVNIH